jgi:hypothetical protein
LRKRDPRCRRPVDGLQAWQNLYYLPEIEAYEQILLDERSAGMQTERTAAAVAARKGKTGKRKAKASRQARTA